MQVQYMSPPYHFPQFYPFVEFCDQLACGVLKALIFTSTIKKVP